MKKKRNQYSSVEHFYAFDSLKSNANKVPISVRKMSEDVFKYKGIFKHIAAHDTHTINVAPLCIHYAVINYYARHVDKGLS